MAPRRPRARQLALVVALTLGVFLPGACFEAFVAMQVRALGPVPIGPALAPREHRFLWAQLGENTEDFPCEWVGSAVAGFLHWQTPRPGRQAAGQAARLWVLDQPPMRQRPWHARNFAGMMWLTCHADARGLTALVAARGHFGARRRGLDAGALERFGVLPQALSDAQLATLLSLGRQPRLAQQPDKLRRRRDALLRQLGAAGVLTRHALHAALSEPLVARPSFDVSLSGAAPP